MNFVVFADDWGLHPSSAQHIFRHIAREHQVLWVNTVGMRTLRLSPSDLRKALGKIAAMLNNVSTAAVEWTLRPPHLHVIQPPMLPLPQSRLAARFNAFSVRRAIQKEMSRLSMKDAVFVTTVPNAVDVMKEFDGAKIYYCVDDFSQWPGLAHNTVQKMEQRLVAHVDLVLAASPVLQARFSDLHSRVELFSHGVDLDLFRDPLPTPLEWLARLPQPRMGFYGLLDERLDQDLIATLARVRPDWSFVLAGPQVAAFPAIEKLDNVYFPGNIRYGDLPKLVRGLDALVMPYRVDAFTHTLAPLKLNEYLLSGRAVVTSVLAGVPKNHPLIRVASSIEDWLAALNDVHDTDHALRRELASDMLASQGWESRALSLLEQSAGIRRS